MREKQVVADHLLRVGVPALCFSLLACKQARQCQKAERIESSQVYQWLFR